MKKRQRSHFPYQRRIKVRKHYEQYPQTFDNIQGVFHLLEKVPSITLQGDWLKQARFRYKTKVLVTVSEGCLVIQIEK